MAHAVAAPASSQALSVSTVQCRYFGFSLRETTGAATATVRIRAGGSATGKILDEIQLSASESAREWYGPQGVSCTGDIYYELVSGTVEGSVRYE